MLPPATQTKLYGNPLSAHFRAVWVFLLGSNIPFQLVQCANAAEVLSHFEDVKVTDKPNFIPVLVTDGEILSGSLTILRYLGSKTNKFYPNTLTLRAKIDLYFEWHRSTLYKVSSGLIKLLNPKHPALYRQDVISSSGSSSGSQSVSTLTTPRAAGGVAGGGNSPNVGSKTSSRSGSDNSLRTSSSTTSIGTSTPGAASTVAAAAATVAGGGSVPSLGGTGAGVAAASTWDADEIGTGYTKYLNALSMLESFLSDSKFLTGDELTVADMLAFAELQFSEVVGIDVKDYPKLHAWHTAVREVPQLSNAWITVSKGLQEMLPKLKQEQEEAKKTTDNMKKRGRDARGGSRPPDVCHVILFYRPVTEVFRMLTVQEEWSKVVGKPCEIGNAPGSAFKFHDGAISGTTLYKLDNIKLLQSWRMNDWPDGVFSTTKYAFASLGEEKCEVRMEQSDIPSGSFKKIDEQWLSLMWGPLGGIPLREIRQTIVFDYASPHMLYDLLMDSAKASKWMRAKCEVSRGSGASLSYLDGTITGSNIELTTDTKIVQSWRLNDWPAGHYSKVTICISRVFGGSDLSFHQEDIPGGKMRPMADLLEKHFWRRLRREITQNYDTHL